MSSTSDASSRTCCWGLEDGEFYSRSNGRTWIEDPKSLTRFTFTLQALRSAPYSHTPNNLGDGVFVFLAPRHRNLFAPIDCLFGPTSRLPDHVLPHRCFGQRVLHFILPSLSGDPDPVCGKACTTLTTSTSEPEVGVVSRSVSPEIFEVPDSDDEFPDMLIDSVAVYQSDNGTESHSGPAASIQSARTIVTRAAARQQWQEQAAAAAVPISNVAIFVPGPLLLSAMELSPPRSYLGPMAPVDLTLQHMPGSGPCNLVAWQNHLLGPRDMDDHIVITASSVDEGARALITLCFWLCSHPTNLKLKEVLTEHGPGIGRGPRNEVVAEALKILFADGRFWTEREGYLTLRLHPSCTPIPYRFCISKATGLIFLLHFLFIGAPLPASPFLFLTLFDGRAIAYKFDVDFLSTFISHTSLGLIKRIVGGPLDAPLYSSQGEFCEEYQSASNGIRNLLYFHNRLLASAVIMTPYPQPLLRTTGVFISTSLTSFHVIISPSLPRFIARLDYVTFFKSYKTTSAVLPLTTLYITIFPSHPRVSL
ncbi:hypothetical protein R3P38DRAFT_3243766 [Favolaschia claudopus]|uniref:Uncharacterized protein n=1 Tax=Favolaschia claudopus TaxID=2862362 RepID=A0AAV9Z2Y1_9AGAR